jgi:hypothetical protein
MPGLIRAATRTAVVAGTATAVSGRVARRQQGRWAEQDQQQSYQAQQAAGPPVTAAPPAQAAPAPDPGDMDAKIAQLRQLSELNQQGVLTDAEFAAQKARILGS